MYTVHIPYPKFFFQFFLSVSGTAEPISMGFSAGDIRNNLGYFTLVSLSGVTRGLNNHRGVQLVIHEDWLTRVILPASSADVTCFCNIFVDVQLFLVRV